METLYWIWFDLLGIPIGYFETWFNADLSGTVAGTVARLVVLLAIWILLYQVIYLGWRFYKYRVRGADSLTADDVDLEQLYAADDVSFQQNIKAARNLKGVIAPLKKARNWVRIAEIYAQVNQPKEAARYFSKAKEKRRAAMEWAKAGATLRAARMLERAGDYANAGRMFGEKGRHRAAARAYQKGNDIPRAAAALVQANRVAQAAAVYQDYFRTSQDPPEIQIAAADSCYAMLRKDVETKRPAIAQDLRKSLTKSAAERFEGAQRNALAASMFEEAGDLASAGRTYKKAGKLQEASQCLKKAGLDKEAARVGGQHYESLQRWREAGMAYEGAGDYIRAGDCFSKANEATRAAGNYAMGGEYFGAGYALLHAKQWQQAIPMFQKLREGQPRFDESRAYLGRCFYEMKDYDSCVASLENHLTGARVTTDNIDYFWMLALAYEQLGKLEESRQTLLKIRTVNVGYRDVSQRLSFIESRISMAQQGTGPVGADGQAPSQAQPADPVMSMVDSSVGSRYEIERELGRGGMGVVYLATDTQLERKVALKFLGSLVDNDPDFKARFVREAKAAAKVSHPNIVSIYEISALEGRAYIAMEYIEGPNLQRYLREKGKLSPREAINIVGQACSALQSVHEAGVVHRDLKPDNIVITRGGLVKLMDFGLAKSNDKRLTASNIVMGTPCYMAPEQAMGKDADTRADIYAMGLVLYETLTGEIVFGSGDVLQRQINEVPPPPSSKVADLPESLDAIVMKCVQKAPNDRYQNVGALIAALRDVKAVVA